jgi:hypothetical protein
MIGAFTARIPAISSLVAQRLVLSVESASSRDMSKATTAAEMTKMPEQSNSVKAIFLFSGTRKLHNIGIAMYRMHASVRMFNVDAV